MLMFPLRRESILMFTQFTYETTCPNNEIERYCSCSDCNYSNCENHEDTHCLMNDYIHYNYQFYLTSPGTGGREQTDVGGTQGCGNGVQLFVTRSTKS